MNSPSSLGSINNYDNKRKNYISKHYRNKNRKDKKTKQFSNNNNKKENLKLMETPKNK
jgi:hypothetical protein